VCEDVALCKIQQSISFYHEAGVLIPIIGLPWKIDINSLGFHD
jgi:hypothetical protein